jgi:hypothetical protein
MLLKGMIDLAHVRRSSGIHSSSIKMIPVGYRTGCPGKQSESQIFHVFQLESAGTILVPISTAGVERFFRNKFTCVSGWSTGRDMNWLHCIAKGQICLALYQALFCILFSGVLTSTKYVKDVMPILHESISERQLPTYSRLIFCYFQDSKIGIG